MQNEAHKPIAQGEFEQSEIKKNRRKILFNLQFLKSIENVIEFLVEHWAASRVSIFFCFFHSFSIYLLYIASVFIKLSYYLLYCVCRMCICSFVFKCLAFVLCATRQIHNEMEYRVEYTNKQAKKIHLHTYVWHISISIWTNSSFFFCCCFIFFHLFDLSKKSGRTANARYIFLWRCWLV